MVFCSAGKPPKELPSSASSESADGWWNDRLSYFGDLPLFRDAESTKSQDAKPSRMEHHFRGWEYIVGSWLNILIFFLPVAWIVGFTETKIKGLVFTCCIVAIVPLVRLHELSTRELSLRFGGSKAGLINGSMSNLIEVVIAIAALRKCELRVVQSSLVGAILAKILLVLGMCLFAGGLRFTEQDFNPTANQINSSLLSISVSAVLLPAVYHFVLNGATTPSDEETDNIMRMSHGVSIILLIVYASYLIFQLWSHPHLYKDNDKQSELLALRLPKVPPAFAFAHKNSKEIVQSNSCCASFPASDPPRYGSSSSETTWHPSTSKGSYSHDYDDGTATLTSPAMPQPLHAAPSMNRYDSASPCGNPAGIFGERSSSAPPVDAASSKQGHPTVRLVTTDLRYDHSSSSSPGSGRSSTLCGSPLRDHSYEDDSDRLMVSGPSEPEPGHSLQSRPKEPKLSLTLNLVLLVLVPVIVSVTVDRLVESMNEISNTVEKAWIGLILLPAVTSVAECLSAVNTSVKDQLSFSINLAVGSTIQTALLIIPFMVTLGWATGKPLTLLFDPFESVVLYISVQTMSYVVADGKSNWLEGFILICFYVVIAVAFWYYPGSGIASSIAATCIPSD